MYGVRITFLQMLLLNVFSLGAYGILRFFTLNVFPKSLGQNDFHHWKNQPQCNTLKVLLHIQHK